MIQTVRPAPWTAQLGVQVAASIYATPPERRLLSALAAHQAGQHVHVDIILRTAEDGITRNQGVGIDAILEIFTQEPLITVEVHLIIMNGCLGWEMAADEVARLLSTVPISRWIATPVVLDQISSTIPYGVERWAEVGPTKDKFPHDTLIRFDGALVMLITPGSTETADPDAITHVSELAAKGMRVGVDGGVTPSVAQRVVSAGGSHLVIGRALWAPSLEAKEG